MVSSRSSFSWAAGQGKLCMRGWSEQSTQRWRTLIKRWEASGTENPPHQKKKNWMEVDLLSVVSDFSVGHPASWVGIFRGAFLSRSFSILSSAIGFLWLWWGGGSSVPGSALGTHRLLLPTVFQGFWLGVPLIFPKSTLSSHVLCWLPFLI
jgi:hypothetical protein